MSIFAISDLHLSLSGDKPMSIFGGKWENYTDRMRQNWNRIVSENDIVIIPGDISWATYIDDAAADFEYINSLNGKKLLLKGNHDYWWTTLKKMDTFLEANGLNTIEIINNTAVMCGDTAVCGTRGWTIPAVNSTSEDVKIFEREKQRLILSLEDAKRKRAKRILAAMHYPPLEKEGARSDFLDIMKEYGVEECVFGHLHAAAHKAAPVGVYSGVKLRLVSCDYLDFVPALIERQ